jgi:hypothetical protein
MATIRRRTRQGGVSFHVQVRIKGHAPETAAFRRLTDAIQASDDFVRFRRDAIKVHSRCVSVGS